MLPGTSNCSSSLVCDDAAVAADDGNDGVLTKQQTQFVNKDATQCKAARGRGE